MGGLTALLLILTAARGQSLLHRGIFITRLNRQRRRVKKLVVRLDPNALEIEVVSTFGQDRVDASLFGDRGHLNARTRPFHTSPKIKAVSALGVLASCSAWATCSSSVSGLWHMGNFLCPGGPRLSRSSSIANSSSRSSSISNSSSRSSSHAGVVPHSSSIREEFDQIDYHCDFSPSLY